MSPFGIHWFRRDLRVAGNQALRVNLQAHKGRVVGLFCFDSIFLSREDFSHNRFAFFIKTLRALKEELQALGSDLLVVDELPDKAFPNIFKSCRPELVTFNRDYEPFARSRDEKLLSIFAKEGVSAQHFRDHLLIEPHELFKVQPGDFYQVYSPFAKKWFDLLAQPQIKERVSSQAQGLKYLQSPPNQKIFSLTWKDLANEKFPYQDKLDEFETANNKKVTIPIPEAGSRVALERLQQFTQRLSHYKEQRDIPSLDGTSLFSLYFKNGSLTSAQVIQALQLGDKSFKTEDSQNRFLKEIAWREFYYHILYHRPDVEKAAFLEKYRNIKWQNNKEWFQRWCEGTTGFPIVDAGMRQLNTTGWMHNRVRMIVASFLCKDLLIDWRWGENYFMKMLLDGDLAPNNGGWQWAASTGCDPQPYFRIFNPWLQSAKFDPEATYIKKYVPELKNISAKIIHDPEGDRGSQYAQPIVEHASQKKWALQLYQVNE